MRCAAEILGGSFQQTWTHHCGKTQNQFGRCKPSVAAALSITTHALVASIDSRWLPILPLIPLTSATPSGPSSPGKVTEDSQTLTNWTQQVWYAYCQCLPWHSAKRHVTDGGQHYQEEGRDPKYVCRLPSSQFLASTCVPNAMSWQIDWSFGRCKIHIRGYWQVPVDQNSWSNTALIASYGLFQFKAMLFGLQGAPATSNAWWIRNVIIYSKSKSWRDHDIVTGTIVSPSVRGTGKSLEFRETNATANDA